MPWAGEVLRVQAADADASVRAAAMLEETGAVVIEGVVASAHAAELAALVLAAEADIPAGGISAISMLLNRDTSGLVERLVCQPLAVAVAHAIIGTRTENTPNAFAWPAHDQVRLQSCDGLVNQPGSPGQGWHMDPPASQIARPVGDGPPGARSRVRSFELHAEATAAVSPICALSCRVKHRGLQLPPDFTMGINCIYMLTDFSRENGCTRVVLDSHRRREVPSVFADGRHQGHAWSALEEGEDGEPSSGCTGPAGSVAVVCNNTWHAAGANQTQAPRVGLAISYIPWYLGRVTMDLVPITPAAFGRLQTSAGRALTRHQLGWVSTGESTDAMGGLGPSCSPARL